MISHLKNANLLKIGNSHKNFHTLLHTMMVKSSKTNIILTSLLVSACMLTTSLVNGGMAYGAEAPAGDENFNYNGYSATQLKAISECISGVIPAVQCPSYEASSKDYYTETDGTVNHVNMPTGVISTKTGWLQWADAAMKANSYDGVYGTLKIAPGGATGATSSTGNEVSNVRFRLIGINKDNRADGTGKAGLTFQAIGAYNIKSAMNTANSNAGGWRDSLLRKKMNDESTGAIWNAIQSTDLKNNITPVLKTTNYNSNYISDTTSNASSNTVDKLFILSPSEMGMPVIESYNVAAGHGFTQYGANVHYHDLDTYSNTIKSSSDGNFDWQWFAFYNYLYSGDAYQWWMLPAGSRKMSNGNQAYHNTDSYSYYDLFTSSNPSANKKIVYDSYWLRSVAYYNGFATYGNRWYPGHLDYQYANNDYCVVVSFSL